MKEKTLTEPITPAPDRRRDGLRAVVRDAVWELRNRSGATDADIADVLERALAEAAPLSDTTFAWLIERNVVDKTPARLTPEPTEPEVVEVEGKDGVIHRVWATPEPTDDRETTDGE
jgi:hypothetical protein